MKTYPITRVILHWLIAIIVIGLFATGFWMVTLDYYSEWYTKVPHWHKSVGMLFSFLLALGIVYRRLSSRPDYENSLKIWERLSAKLVQSLMTLLCIGIVMTGYVITTANGDPVSVFNWFSLPALNLHDLIAKFSSQKDLSGKLHKWMAYAVIALSVLHAGAALFHHFVKKDRTLLKILGK